MFGFQTILWSMTGHDQFKHIMDTFLRVVEKFRTIERTPRHFGLAEKLYMQEVHTLAAIGETPDINVTRVAERLGVTKSTVSPIISRLARKQLVTKQKAADNQKEVLLRLTVKGEVAYHAHEMLHRQLQAAMYAALHAKYGDQVTEYLEFAENFLRIAEELVDQQAREMLSQL
jgi:DNA-binding MarR family transcriptional regulator